MSLIALSALASVDAGPVSIVEPVASSNGEDCVPVQFWCRHAGPIIKWAQHPIAATCRFQQWERPLSGNLLRRVPLEVRLRRRPSRAGGVTDVSLWFSPRTASGCSSHPQWLWFSVVPIGAESKTLCGRNARNSAWTSGKVVCRVDDVASSMAALQWQLECLSRHRSRTALQDTIFRKTHPTFSWQNTQDIVLLRPSLRSHCWLAVNSRPGTREDR